MCDCRPVARTARGRRWRGQLRAPPSFRAWRDRGRARLVENELVECAVDAIVHRLARGDTVAAGVCICPSWSTWCRTACPSWTVACAGADRHVDVRTPLGPSRPRLALALRTAGGEDPAAPEFS